MIWDTITCNSCVTPAQGNLCPARSAAERVLWGDRRACVTGTGCRWPDLRGAAGSCEIWGDGAGRTKPAGIGCSAGHIGAPGPGHCSGDSVAASTCRKPVCATHMLAAALVYKHGGCNVVPAACVCRHLCTTRSSVWLCPVPRRAGGTAATAATVAVGRSLLTLELFFILARTGCHHGGAVK